MQTQIPDKMKAAAIDRFGGPEEITTHTLPVPEPRKGEILIRVHTAGIGVWDPYDREGELTDEKPKLPHVLGTDGAGTVVKVGEGVTRFREGDRVYAYSFGEEDRGFYAEYALAKADNAALLPKNLDLEHAGPLAADAITALRGLRDQLKVKKDQRLLIFGASGGIGHLAIQLAHRMGAKVLAVASGNDGVGLAQKLGAEEVVEGHRGDLQSACRRFAPDGLDAALVLTGGDRANEAVKHVRHGGRVAWPNGVEPTPQIPDGIKGTAYDGVPSRELLDELNRLIEAGPFHVELGRTYRLDEAARAHRELQQHHLGKIALRVMAS